MEVRCAGGTVRDDERGDLALGGKREYDKGWAARGGVGWGSSTSIGSCFTISNGDRGAELKSGSERLGWTRGWGRSSIDGDAMHTGSPHSFLRLIDRERGSYSLCNSSDCLRLLRARDALALGTMSTFLGTASTLLGALLDRLRGGLGGCGDTVRRRDLRGVGLGAIAWAKINYMSGLGGEAEELQFNELKGSWRCAQIGVLPRRVV